MCVSNDLDSSMRIVVLFLRVIILEGLSGELVFRMYIGIVDVTKSYYFWSGVIEVLCLRTRLTYKSDSALACIYLHCGNVVWHE